MGKPTLRRIAVGGLTVLAVIAVGGTASAIWSASGGGSGSGGSGTAVAVSLSPGAPESELYPGGSADVVLTISNPNEADVRIGSLVLTSAQGTGGFGVDEAHDGCDVAALDFSTATDGWVAPGAVAGTPGTLPVTLVDALTMDLDADNACQGATFTVYVTAGP